MTLLSGNEAGGAGERFSGREMVVVGWGGVGWGGVVHQHKGDTAGNREPKKNMREAEGGEQRLLTVQEQKRFFFLHTTAG